VVCPTDEVTRFVDASDERQYANGCILLYVIKCVEGNLHHVLPVMCIEALVMHDWVPNSRWSTEDRPNSKFPAGITEDTAVEIFRAVMFALCQRLAGASSA
jgi:hypothetical protein